MANRQRLVEQFIELVKVDSLSLHERAMADTLKEKLVAMGFEVYEDEAGLKCGGDAGNIICDIKGTKAVAPIIFMAHMDTVGPGIGKKPIIDGDYIRSSGDTILGSDDVAGIVAIFEMLNIIKDESIEHGNIQIVFSIAEEIGLVGAANLDYSRISAKYGFVLDCSGEVGHIAVKAPSHNSMNVVIKGKAAHAGIEPEKGISAIQIASEAISMMKLGRIDEETTANIGQIQGGIASNIVCDKVEIKAECRSLVLDKLDTQTEHMRECFQKAVEKYGGAVDFTVMLEYPSFQIEEDSQVISILKRASYDCGIKLTLKSTGGGSDTNIINGKGIIAANLGIGMEKVHSTEECINIESLVKSADFLTAIVKCVEK